MNRSHRRVASRLLTSWHPAATTGPKPRTDELPPSQDEARSVEYPGRGEPRAGVLPRLVRLGLFKDECGARSARDCRSDAISRVPDLHPHPCRQLVADDGLPDV